MPEVEIVRRNCERWGRGRRLLEVDLVDPALLVSDGEHATSVAALESLVGARLVAAHRRGKRLALELDGGRWLGMHFRMTGKLVRGTGIAHGRLRLVLDGDGDVAARTLWFKDPRRLGALWCMDAAGARRWLEAQGPEPWPEPLSPDVLARCLAPVARRQLKSALLDQQVVAGLGNIAVCEALWRARLSPAGKVGALDEAERTRLGQAVVDHIDHVLEAEDGDEVAYIGEAGALNPFCVYGRAGEPCPRCEQAIETVRQGGRVTFWCRGCQAM